MMLKRCDTRTLTVEGQPITDREVLWHLSKVLEAVFRQAGPESWRRRVVWDWEADVYSTDL